jgi:hypothetical protein
MASFPILYESYPKLIPTSAATFTIHRANILPHARSSRTVTSCSVQPRQPGNTLRMRERMTSIQSYTQRTMEQIGNADTDPALRNCHGSSLNNRAQFIVYKEGLQAKPLKQAICRWSRSDKQTFPSPFQTYLNAAVPRIQLKKSLSDKRGSSVPVPQD